MNNVTYRGVDGPTATDADWNAIDAVLQSRSWPMLDRRTSSVLVAEDHEGICGLSVIQLVPHSEPLVVSPRLYGMGVAEALADMTVERLKELGISRCMAVAENPLAEGLCEARGYERVKRPVYVRMEA